MKSGRERKKKRDKLLEKRLESASIQLITTVTFLNMNWFHKYNALYSLALKTPIEILLSLMIFERRKDYIENINDIIRSIISELRLTFSLRFCEDRKLKSRLILNLAK